MILIIRITTYFWVATGIMNCTDENAISESLNEFNPPKPSINEYLTLLCSTQIRNTGLTYFRWQGIYLLIMVFLFFGYAILVRTIDELFGKIINSEYENIEEEESIVKRYKATKLAFSFYKIIAVIVTFILGICNLFFTNPIDFNGQLCNPLVYNGPSLDTILTCHFHDEFFIKQLSDLSTALTVITFFLLFFSLIPLFAFGFQRKSNNEQHS